MKINSIFVIFFFLTACKFVPTDDAKNESYLKEGPAFSVLLKPNNGSIYRYSVINKTDVEAEVNEQEVVSKNYSDMIISYTVGRDTANDLLLIMQYEKIKMQVQNDKQEIELDADNAKYSLSMLEKMLGGLKESKFEVLLKPNGTVKNIGGFKEAGDRVFKQIQFKNLQETKVARELWDKTIEANMVRQNVNQFFRIFPDSSVHLREKWTITQTQEGEFDLKTTTTYFVKAITEDKVFVESLAEITSNNDKNETVGNVANLKGEQNGEYVLELKTGMLLSAKLTATLKGTVKMQGIEAPLKIKTQLIMENKADK